MILERNKYEFVTDKKSVLFIPVHTRAKIDVLVLDHDDQTSKIEITSQKLNRILFLFIA